MSPKPMDAKLHFFKNFLHHVFAICVLKLPAGEEAKSHLLHFFHFFLLSVFKCLLKWPATEDAYCIYDYSHTVYVCSIFLHYVFKEEFKVLGLEHACMYGWMFTLVRGR